MLADLYKFTENTDNPGNRTNSKEEMHKRSTDRHLAVKGLQDKDEEKVSKAARGKQQVTREAALREAQRLPAEQ